MAAPRSISGGKALLIALPLALVLAWGERTRGPSRDELAQALTRAAARPVSPSDIQSVKCNGAEAGEGYLCRWRQREGGVWRSHAGRLGANNDGWRLIGD